MSTPATSTTILPIDAFKARAEARAYLVAQGELDHYEALDGLQADAARTGLVDEYGQDLIQILLSAAFAPYQRPPPPAPAEPEPEDKPERGARPTPESTIEALMHALRGGLSCLSDRGNRDRLRLCDADAMRQIAGHLLNLHAGSKGREQDWTQDEVNKLLDAWEALQ